MKAAYLRAPWLIELRDIALPDPLPPRHALLEIEACGICGTDLTSAVEAKDWMPIGHEIAARILALPPDAPASLRVGGRVVLESSSFCGHCARCRDGRVDRCSSGPNFWSASLGFAERMIAPLSCLVPYDGIDAEVACLAEPAGVAIDLVRTAGIELADRVCVVGPGPIGLMAVALAQRSGAREVVCVGRPRNRARLDFARSLGAEVVVHDGPLSGLSALRRRFDHVLMTAPARHVAEGLTLLDVAGKLTYLGIGAGDGEIRIDANDFHYRKLQLRASFASPALYLPQALALLTADIIPGRRLISDVLPLDRLSDAFACSRDGTPLKVVIRPG